MGTDVEVIEFLEIQAELSHSEPIGDCGCDSESNPMSRPLQEALTRNLPMIRRRVEAATQSEWSLHDYLERLHRRLRNRWPVTGDLDQAIEAGIKCLLHEDAR